MMISASTASAPRCFRPSVVQAARPHLQRIIKCHRRNIIQQTVQASSPGSTGGGPQPEDEAPSTSGSPAQPDLVKEALDLLNSDSMSLETVMGKDNYGRLEGLLGVEKVQQIAGFLDPVLRNRRALTLASALLDVAVILFGIKLFQGYTSGEQ